MSSAKILVCLDTDAQPSVFDSVVAIDAGANHLLRHSGVKPEGVRELVYGAIFTRAPEELKNTAIFVGGSDVTAGERVLSEIAGTFFGPMRVSAMLDSNGANTTAAAAAIAAGRHVDLANSTVTVLAGTGSVGKRIVRMLAQEGARLRVASRKLVRGQAVADEVRERVPDAEIESVATASDADVRDALNGADVAISAGPPGIQLLSSDLRGKLSGLAVAIDLNAVPPLGIEGIEVNDKAKDRSGTICYGAIGVGGTKMKIHRAAIQQLFTTNDLLLDAEEVYALGKLLEAQPA